VQFDFLGPWGPAPKTGPWINTIDAGTPSSEVLDLPATIDTPTFLVSWPGQDDENSSGIASYDIYVFTDGSTNETLWLDHTTETSGIYTGEVGHSYAFYSIARDNVGHVESAPSEPDTSTTIVPPINEQPTDISLSNATVLENQPAGIVVGTLSTTDPDAGDTFTYSLVSGTGSADNSSFTVQGNALKTAASFNYEAKNAYSIRVQSTDQGGLWTEKIFPISVTNVNEEPTAHVDGISPTPAQPPGQTVNFNGSSNDVDGSVVGWNGHLIWTGSEHCRGLQHIIEQPDGWNTSDIVPRKRQQQCLV